MKLLKRIQSIGLLVGAMCLTMTSCNPFDLSDYEEDCVVDMRLTFRFSRYGAELLAQEVPSLSVFVFDANDLFVGRFDEMEAANITEHYTMTVPLPPGTYRFVTWGGLVDPNYYLSSPDMELGYVLNPVVGETTLQEFAVRIARQARNSHRPTLSNFVDAVPGALFFGNTEQITITATADQQIELPLIKYTNTINLTVIGLPESTHTRANSYSYMDISLLSPNGSYDFYGDIASNRQMLTYPQHNVTDDGVLTQTSTIYTIRPVFGNEHTLSFYNTETNEEFYSADILNDYIRKTVDSSGQYIYNTQAAVDMEDTFNIELDLRSPVNVTVTVNDYHVNSTGSSIQ